MEILYILLGIIAAILISILVLLFLVMGLVYNQGQKNPTSNSIGTDLLLGKILEELSMQTGSLDSISGDVRELNDPKEQLRKKRDLDEIIDILGIDEVLK